MHGEEICSCGRLYGLSDGFMKCCKEIHGVFGFSGDSFEHNEAAVCSDGVLLQSIHSLRISMHASRQICVPCE